VLYDPAWLSLLDLRERLKARGHEAAEVETAICLALRDMKFKLHIAIEKVTYAPTGGTLAPAQVHEITFKEGVKLRPTIPFDLNRVRVRKGPGHTGLGSIGFWRTPNVSRFRGRIRNASSRR
jgi:hypothetical protein